MNSAALALAALVPLMIGPLPAAERSITARLCNGGSIVIPIGNKDEPEPAPCPQKGCHAACNRKRFDLAQ
ncbi:MAG: hypothetical protein R3E14_02750 [Erythrobacter sp.]